MTNSKEEQLHSQARLGLGRLVHEQVAAVDPDAFEERPQAAWRYATHRVMPEQNVPLAQSWERDETSWRCWSCHQNIRESHPDNGPDAQQGHAAGCPRRPSHR